MTMAVAVDSRKAVTSNVRQFPIQGMLSRMLSWRTHTHTHSMGVCVCMQHNCYHRVIASAALAVLFYFLVDALGTSARLFVSRFPCTRQALLAAKRDEATAATHFVGAAFRGSATTARVTRELATRAAHVTLDGADPEELFVLDPARATPRHVVYTDDATRTRRDACVYQVVHAGTTRCARAVHAGQSAQLGACVGRHCCVQSPPVSFLATPVRQAEERVFAARRKQPFPQLCVEQVVARAIHLVQVARIQLTGVGSEIHRKRQHNAPLVAVVDANHNQTHDPPVDSAEYRRAQVKEGGEVSCIPL